MHVPCGECGAEVNAYCTFEVNGRVFRRHCPCKERMLTALKETS